MASCRELIEEFISQGGERGALSGNLDYKAAISWPKKGTDERAKLIRHMIAFANSRDGGYLLIGVDDKTKKPIGLTGQQLASWDVSSVVESLDPYAGPVPVLDICQADLPSGEVLVLVRIAPFSEQPVVCLRDHIETGVGTRPRRTLLRKGALYVRTTGASTTEANTEPLLRELLDRACIKKGAQLLQQIGDLLAAHGITSPQARTNQYDEEISTDFMEMGWP